MYEVEVYEHELHGERLLITSIEYYKTLGHVILAQIKQWVNNLAVKAK